MLTVEASLFLAIVFSASRQGCAIREISDDEVDLDVSQTDLNMAPEESSNSDLTLVVVPGVRRDRSETVLSNIEWLKVQRVPFECLIYAHESLEPDFSARAWPCTVVEHPGFWMDHIAAVPLNSTQAKYVLQMMDGVKPNPVNLRRLIGALEDNDLVHVAPALVGKRWWPQMIPQLGFGRLVPFIEFHFDLFTRSEFACLLNMVAGRAATPSHPFNHLGWGVDLALPKECPGRLGIVDVMRTQKLFRAGYNYSLATVEESMFLKDHPALDVSNLNISLGPLVGKIFPEDVQCDGGVDPTCIGASDPERKNASDTERTKRWPPPWHHCFFAISTISLVVALLSYFAATRLEEQEK